MACSKDGVRWSWRTDGRYMNEKDLDAMFPLERKLVKILEEFCEAGFYCDVHIMTRQAYKRFGSKKTW